MAAHSSSMPASIPFRTLRISTGVILGLGLGGLLLAALVYFIGGGEHHERFWHALHFNWLFWGALAQGMVMLAVALHLTNARWAWSIRRFALAGVMFLPVATLLFPLVHWGGHEHFFHHWLHAEGDPIIAAKSAWLTVGGMFWRDMLGLVIMLALSVLFARNALRPDVYGAEKLATTDAGQRGWYRRLTGGFGTVADEAAAGFSRNNRLGVFLALAYAVIWGMIAIDQAMTMLPHWFSTMFPVAFFVTGFHGGICMTAVMVVLLRKRIGLEPFITRSQFHDLGKLVFAFAVFWMYLNWSQYVVIWYGLLPHEQEWFVLRFKAPFTTLSQLVPFLVFVVPFFTLLTRPPKMMPGFLAAIAVVILVGHWLERFMITVPSVYEGQTLPFGLPEILMGLGFLGLFMACYLWFMKTFPVLPSPASLRAQGTGEIQVPATAPVTAH